MSIPVHIGELMNTSGGICTMRESPVFKSMLKDKEKVYIDG
jgi:hypothetical protein